jgi:hypothetical protein
MDTPHDIPSAQKPSRGVRICILAAVAIIGAIILDQLEQSSPLDVRIFRIVGGAAIALIIAAIPGVLIRSWVGVVVAIVIICLMDWFVVRLILAGHTIR